MLSRHGCDATATGSTAAAAARSCTRVSGQRSRVWRGVRASSRRGVTTPPQPYHTDAERRGTHKSEHRNHVLSPHGCNATATGSTEVPAAARSCTRVSGQRSRVGRGVRASSRRGVTRRTHNHTTPMPRIAVLKGEHRNHVLSPHGCDATATGSTAAAAARSCTRVSGQRSRVGRGVGASSRRGVTTRPQPHHRCRAVYSQASIGITCSHLTAATPPPPAALRQPPPAAAHG